MNFRNSNLSPASYNERCYRQRVREQRRDERRVFWLSVLWLIVLLIGMLAVAARAHGAETRTFTVTAYCPCKVCCGPNAQGLTASGKRVRPGMCAAPRSIPFGTKLYVPGAGWLTVEDRLAARFDERIDVYMTSHKAAVRWGVKTLKVTVAQ